MALNTCPAAVSTGHEHSTSNPQSKPRPRAGVRGLRRSAKKSFLLIHPMWSSESERIGTKRCSSIGYALHIIGCFVTFASLPLLLLIVCSWLGSLIFVAYSFLSYWLFIIPIIVGFCGVILFRISSMLVNRKEFSYDYEKDLSTWVDNGKEQSYCFKTDNAEQGSAHQSTTAPDLKF